MRRFFTVVVLLSFALAVLVQAEEKQQKLVKIANRYSIANKTMKVIPKNVEQMREGIQTNSFGAGSGFVQPPMRLNKINGETVAAQIDSSKNGYGWLNVGIRSIDRFVGTDANGLSVDRLFTVYRQALPGDTYTGYIGAHEIDVSNGLDNATYYRATHVEVDLASDGSIGGRYPSAIALDYPFAAFNWYRAQHATTGANFSHPYLVTDYSNGYVTDEADYDWTSPDWLMDDGWLHPDLASAGGFFPEDAKENRLWSGATDVVKDGNGEYHFAGIYSHWVSDQEKQTFGLVGDQVALAAHTDDPTSSMTYSWNEGTDPTIWEYADVTILTRAIDMNSSGFGVIATIGQLNYPVDSSLYYDTLYVTYTTTNDYGYTWSEWDTLSFFQELGFPSYIHAQDSVIRYVNDEGDTVWYDGPAEVYCNDQVDVIVSEDNDIYIGFSAFWGGVDGAHGIMYSPYYSGQWVAIYDVDSSYWTGRHIAYNNGVYEGDESLPSHTLFWDSEIDLAFDDAGNIYAAWLDRPRTGVQYGALPRYSVDDDPNTDQRDYKTDIYVARSINGGFDWTGWVNITGTSGVDEYELNMVKTVDSRTDGTVWVAYNVCHDTAGVDPQSEAYVDRKNQIWVREARGLFPPAAIDDTDPLVVRKYSLEQNYPNPFNPVTHIEFVPVKSGKAQLNVYNAAGQLISKLFNGNVKQGARYEFEFDGSTLASGVYFYRLTLEDNSEVKKMVLLK